MGRWSGDLREMSAEEEVEEVEGGEMVIWIEEMEDFRAMAGAKANAKTVRDAVDADAYCNASALRARLDAVAAAMNAPEEDL